MTFRHAFPISTGSRLGWEAALVRVLALWLNLLTTKVSGVVTHSSSLSSASPSLSVDGGRVPGSFPERKQLGKKQEGHTGDVLEI